MSHPSRLALDRHALGDASPDVAAHAVGCSQCQAHLAAVTPALPLPGWVKALEQPRRAWFGPRLLALAAAAASVAVGVVVLPRAQRDEGAAVRAKGLPSVRMWVKRGAQVFAWEGAAVRPGDALRLEVATAGFAWLTVASPQAGVLFAADVAAATGPTLTPTWAVDAAGGEEHLTVILSRAPLSDEAARHAVPGQSQELVVLPVVIAKERAP